MIDISKIISFITSPELTGVFFPFNWVLGAIGVGIDMATGVTTRAYWHGKYIRSKPGSKRKLHGIKIPSLVAFNLFE